MTSPANTIHLFHICTMSAQRLRRWSNIVQMLYKCFVFAGSALFVICPLIIVLVYGVGLVHRRPYGHHIDMSGGLLWILRRGDHMARSVWLSPQASVVQTSYLHADLWEEISHNERKGIIEPNPGLLQSRVKGPPYLGRFLLLLFNKDLLSASDIKCDCVTLLPINPLYVGLYITIWHGSALSA